MADLHPSWGFEHDLSVIRKRWREFIECPDHADVADLLTVQQLARFNRWLRARGKRPVLLTRFIRATQREG